MINLLVILLPLYLFAQPHSHSHTHSPDQIEKSYTYDPFFLDVMTNHMKKENEYLKLGTQATNKKLKDFIVSTQKLNEGSIKKMQSWRTSMYKEVEKVRPDKFDLNSLKNATTKDFNKKMTETLKILFEEGIEIANNGKEQNFETPIKKFSEDLQKAYSKRIEDLKTLEQK